MLGIMSFINQISIVLVLAAENNLLEIGELLISIGADINAKKLLIILMPDHFKS